MRVRPLIQDAVILGSKYQTQPQAIQIRNLLIDQALNANYRPVYRLGRLKEFTHYFAKNYKFGHSLASRVQSSSSMDEARERAGTFFANNSKESMAATGARVGDNESIG